VAVVVAVTIEEVLIEVVIIVLEEVVPIVVDVM